MLPPARKTAPRWAPLGCSIPMGEAGYARSNAISGCRHFPQGRGQARDFPGTGVLVHHALGDGAHQLGLGLHEGVLGGRSVAGGQRLVELAQEGAHARAAGGVDFGSAGDLADRLLGAGRIGHSLELFKRTRPASRGGENRRRGYTGGGAAGQWKCGAIRPAIFRAAYLPVNFAGRFSTNAAMPSFWSSKANSEWNSRRSIFTP